MAGFKAQRWNSPAAPRGSGTEHVERGLRAASAADRGAIEMLLHASALPSGGIDDSLQHFFVCEDIEGGVLGAAGLEVYGNSGLLRSVVVVGSARRRGIAAALVRRAMAHAQSEGCATLYLLTLDAEGYFRRFGFRVVDRENAPAAIRNSAEFATLCPESAVLMFKLLGK